MEFLGIDIGGTKCAVVKGNDKGEVTLKEVTKTTDVKETLGWILNISQKLKGNSVSAGISCGGPLDSKKGIIMSPPNLPGWDNIKIVDMLKEKLGIPVEIQNDANACALAEWKFGAGKGCQNMVFLTFGTGLGAGLILNGRLYSGTNDNAGEIGHIRLCDTGPVGYGKSGSFEGFCSGGGLAELGRTYALEKLQMGKQTMFCKSKDDLGAINAKLIAECAYKGDETAIKVYDTCARMLGKGLSVIIDILNPEKIVIGSIFARSESLLRSQMEKIIKEEALNHSEAVCSIVPAALGDSIGDCAALAVAENAFLKIK